jgi:hypothetical protein
VFCPACGGCGSTGHAGCAGAHAGLDDAGPWDDAEVDGDQPDQDACPSCLGREWNPLQGFDPTGRSTQIKVLRVPCGCTTDRARVWTVVAEQQGRER